VRDAAEQGDEADEAFGGMVALMDMPPHARAVPTGRGHRFAAYPRCSTDYRTGLDRPRRMVMRSRTSFLLALGLAIGLAQANADECGPPGGPNWQPRRGATWTYSAGLGGTAGVFASGGLILGRAPARCNRCGLAAVSSGVLVQMSAGQYSGRASLGYESRNPLVGFGAQATLDHAWRQKGSTAAGTSYAGPEVIAAITPVVVTTGVLWRVAGDAGPRARWSWQLAVGF